MTHFILNISRLFLLMSEGEHTEQHGTGDMSEFVMHHVKDHVILPLHIGNFDISITKHVLMLWVASAILILVTALLFRNRTLVPKGAANMIEGVVVYLKTTIIDPNLGEESYRYAPYLLTAFFFILTCNLLGLVPFGATATGNISVTATLALLTFFFVQFANIRKNGLVGYIKSFVPPGLPKLMVPLIFIVEVLGMMTKHLALAIRLFANMFAGHLVIFTIMGLIFVFKNLFISPFPVLGILFVSLLEVLIAMIQAYIFTILSAVFIGMSVSSHH